jgi:NAD(P)H-hydrate epimerase
MDIPTIARDQMIEVDRLMIEEYGILLIQMMENAGRNLAEMGSRLLDGSMNGRKVVVLCGAGNNGGGGMVAARHLSNRGADVKIKLVGSPERIKEVPAHQWHILQIMELPEAQPGDLVTADLIVDAMVGYGLTGDLHGKAAAWVGLVHQAGQCVLSLDVPSGLDANLGMSGRVCIRADATLTLALPKMGLMSDEAGPYVGDLYLADIGVPSSLYHRIGLDIGLLFEEDTIIRVF